jgi:hypothetical protein
VKMADENEDTQMVEANTEIEPVNKNKRYRKPKPWDTDDIDHVSSPNFKLENFANFCF